jgi:Zn-dependent protease
MSTVRPWSRAEFPSRPWRIIVSSIFGIMAAFSCGPIADAIAGRSDGAVWATVIVIPLVWALTTFVHEIGHAVAAKIIGWRVHIIAVKPFAFRPAQRKFGFAPRLKTADVGGFVFATPKLFSRRTKKEAVFLVGGAVANLLWGTIALILAASFTASPKWSNVFGSLGLVSLIAGIFNLVPIWWEKDRGTDGALLWDLWRGRQLEEAERCFAWLSALYIDGVPLRLWPRELIAIAESVFASNATRRKIDPFLVMYYMSVGRLSDARSLLERSEIGKAMPELAIGHALLLCIMDKQGARARDLLDGVPERYHGKYFFCRADAFAHFYNGKEGEARAAAIRAEQLAMKQGLALGEEEKSILSALKEGRPIPVQISSIYFDPP